jgi:antitoxin component YwqK of YwqJK toxin-antitoxin module
MSRYILFAICSVFLLELSAQELINQTDDQGLKQGLWKKKAPNGTLIYAGEFKDNKPIGEFKRYFENGSVKSLMVFSEENDSVPTTMFYDNGKKASEGIYLNKQKVGEWKYFSYYRGHLSATESFVQGKREGIEKKYFETGNVSEETDWVNDKKQGAWKLFYSNGTIKSEATYTQGVLEGYYKVYFSNGVMEIYGFYKNGMPHGNWQYFSETSKLKTQIEYNMGLPVDEEGMDKKQQEFFEMVEENKGKFEDPSVEDVMGY